MLDTQKQHEHYDKCRSVWTDFIDSLDANKGLHELKTRKLTIVPLFYKTSSEASGINKLADELFERGDDYLCCLYIFAVPPSSFIIAIKTYVSLTIGGLTITVFILSAIVNAII